MGSLLLHSETDMTLLDEACQSATDLQMVQLCVSNKYALTHFVCRIRYRVSIKQTLYLT